MHQTRKGNQWYFGMKLHIGVDDQIGLIHRLETTPANTHDLEAVDKLFHGDEERILVTPATAVSRSEKPIETVQSNGISPSNPVNESLWTLKATRQKWKSSRARYAPRLSTLFAI